MCFSLYNVPSHSLCHLILTVTLQGGITVFPLCRWWNISSPNFPSAVRMVFQTAVAHITWMTHSTAGTTCPRGTPWTPIPRWSEPEPIHPPELPISVHGTSTSPATQPGAWGWARSSPLLPFPHATSLWGVPPNAIPPSLPHQTTPPVLARALITAPGLMCEPGCYFHLLSCQSYSWPTLAVVPLPFRPHIPTLTAWSLSTTIWWCPCSPLNHSMSHYH